VKQRNHVAEKKLTGRRTIAIRWRDYEGEKRRDQWNLEKLHEAMKSWYFSYDRWVSRVLPSDHEYPLGVHGFGTFVPKISCLREEFQSLRKVEWSCLFVSSRSQKSLASSNQQHRRHSVGLRRRKTWSHHFFHCLLWFIASHSSMSERLYTVIASIKTSIFFF